MGTPEIPVRPALTHPSRSQYDLSLIIACYNEEGHLEDSVYEIIQSLAGTGYSYELIFIDDCSTDNTGQIIENITRDQPLMRHVSHEKNVGRGGTVQEGFGMARGRIVGFLDIDLEIHSRHIVSMVQAIDEGYDGATARRIYKIMARPDHMLRCILSRTYRILLRASLHLPFKDTETGYKFFNREAILPVLEDVKHRGWFWDTEIMVFAHLHGLKVTEIPCRFVHRRDKKSTVRIFKDILDYVVSLHGLRRRIKRSRSLRRAGSSCASS